MPRGCTAMKLTFHIGMGKTGTSAIQASLAASQTALEEHGVHYLGRWWGVVDPGLEGPEGIQVASQLRGASAQRLVDALASHMESVAHKTSVDHFIFSNEALYGHTDSYQDLYTRLLERVDLQFVVFVRDPRWWLASAYAQWGIRHKTRPGPVQTFAEWAASSIGIYSGLRYWHEKFGDRLVARKLEPGQDAVALFMQTVGCDFVIPRERVNETPEPALLLLQAAYNGVFDGPVLPTRFLEDVYDVDALGGPVSTEQLIARHLDGSQITDLVASRRDLFEELRALTGLDLTEDAGEPPAPPAAEPLRARLVDYLVAITLRQARQISALEKRLAELEARPPETE